MKPIRCPQCGEVRQLGSDGGVDCPPCRAERDRLRDIAWPKPSKITAGWAPVFTDAEARKAIERYSDRLRLWFGLPESKANDGENREGM